MFRSLRSRRVQPDASDGSVTLELFGPRLVLFLGEQLAPRDHEGVFDRALRHPRCVQVRVIKWGAYRSAACWSSGQDLLVNASIAEVFFTVQLYCLMVTDQLLVEDF